MARPSIDPRVQVGAARLRVTDLERAAEFYSNMLGFEITYRVGNSAIVLTADGRHPVAYLIHRERTDGPVRASWLSLRFPDRASLDAILVRLTDAGVSPQGPLDDGISEGMFVLDPDGNRIELQVVRPKDTWSLAVAAAIDEDAPGKRHPRDEQADVPRRTGQGTHPAEQPLSESTRARLGEMRTRLLTLHKVLLDDAKAAYELDRGRVPSNATLLQLVINDPWFAWLHPLSELVVRIDEVLHADAPATEADGSILLDEVGRLLSPAEGGEVFAQRYYEALQRQPAVIVAHAEVRRILKQAR